MSRITHLKLRMRKVCSMPARLVGLSSTFPVRHADDEDTTSPSCLALTSLKQTNVDDMPSYMSSFLIEGFGGHDKDATPRERHTTQHHHSSSFSLLDLQGILRTVTDVNLLLQFRDEIDARCKDLQLDTTRHEEENEEEYDEETNDALSMPNVPSIDHGSRTPHRIGTVGNWSIGGTLGEGRYATVFTAKNQSTGNNEAAKIILKDTLKGDEEFADAAREYQVWRKLGSHPNIVGLTGALQSEGYLFFFMDLAKGNDLFNFIRVRQQNRTQIKQEAAMTITGDVASALAHCHGLGVCHRDLKPENVIVAQDYTSKLVDFGCACDRYELALQCVGTMPFIAPECLNGVAKDGAAADVWSLGVIVLELMFGLQALDRALGWDKTTTSNQECGFQLASQFAVPLEGLAQLKTALAKSTDAEVEKLAIRLLHADPNKRVAATDVLRYE